MSSGGLTATSRGGAERRGGTRNVRKSSDADNGAATWWPDPAPPFIHTNPAAKPAAKRWAPEQLVLGQACGTYVR
ncbi:hypothetical protein GCM10023334_062600 [Nonomuraea thailandensis]